MRRLPPACSWLVYLIPFFVIFGPALFTGRAFGLRDAGHYYGPLWRYVNAQWREGIPLWNALEENGRPLAADATASVFYPLKLLFALPVGFETAMELFVIVHLALAMFGAYFAAKSFRLSREAASLAAVSYALSGTVIFLHCNPVFLVGAAWLPVGFGLMQRLFTAGPIGRGWRSHERSPMRLEVWSLSAVMAMMVLGGDPQAAYLLMLVGLIRVLVCPTKGSVSRGAQLAGLGGASLAALLLAAVQILPTYQWSRESERATYDAPRTLFELVEEVAAGESAETDGMLDIPRPGSHRAAIYQFSVGPWRWAELLWPNFGGRPFPRNQRWISAIPAEGRYWTPTMYMGLLPILLGVTAFRSRWADPRRRWLIVSAILFALASLGQYGIVWLSAELRMAMGVYPPERWGPIGGLYWLMTIVLPGFVMFRYPAKLWIIVTLSLSLLAALQADQVVRRGSRPLRRILFAYLLLCLIPIVGTVFTLRWPDWLAAPVDMIYGPFDVDGAMVGVVVAVVHGVVAAVATMWFLRRDRMRDRALIRWIVLITAMDLTLAHYWLVPTVASGRDQSQVKLSLSSSEAETPQRYLRWMGSWYPRQWSIDPDLDRLGQLVEWDRRTLRPKYNLDVSMNALQSYTSFSSANHRAAIEVLYERSEDRSHSFYRLIDVLGVQYLISPADQIHSSHLELHSVMATSTTAEQGAHVWKNKRAYPRAWVVHESQSTAPTRSRRRRERRQYVRAALLESAESLRQKVTLDVTPPPTPLPKRSPRSASDGLPESCRIVRQAGGTIVLDANLNRAGYVVVCESYDPGWKCVVQSEAGAKFRTPVLRANGVMSAIALPAGKHRLTMRYRPTSFLVGAIVSVLGWGGWFAILWLDRRNRAKSTAESPDR